jgi:hypothetical protein
MAMIKNRIGISVAVTDGLYAGPAQLYQGIMA